MKRAFLIGTALLFTGLSQAQAADYTCTASTDLGDGTSFSYDVSFSVNNAEDFAGLEVIDDATVTASHLVGADETVYLDQGLVSLVKARGELQAVVDQSVYGLVFKLVPAEDLSGFDISIRHRIYNTGRTFNSGLFSCEAL
ncbi:MAG: hypothetical protein HRU19_01260 [Pseudobacteriovorax sp.]|nr:hypothetical protein [Pseudobacteriovorax sp.]